MDRYKQIISLTYRFKHNGRVSIAMGSPPQRITSPSGPSYPDGHFAAVSNGFGVIGYKGFPLGPSHPPNPYAFTSPCRLGGVLNLV